MEINTLFDVPVLMIMFNRPIHALQVYERIREVKPISLYLAVDGPRTNQLDDNEAVRQCREIATLVDWPCSIHTLFRDKNLGCRQAVSSAINWFFEHVEAGIILEDDCLPDPTFFEFCRVLLRKYAKEPKVMHIGGANLYGNNKWGSETYFFSSIPHVWGWATWRRAWKFYDVTMKRYPEFKRLGGIKQSVSFPPSQSYWEASFDKTYSGKIDTWDYQWVLAIWLNQGLCIIPNQNLISNIGFGKSATNTFNDSEEANLPTVPIDIKLISHPISLVVNKEANHYAFTQFYQLPSWWRAKLYSLKRRLLSM